MENTTAKSWKERATAYIAEVESLPLGPVVGLGGRLFLFTDLFPPAQKFPLLVNIEA